MAMVETSFSLLIAYRTFLIITSRYSTGWGSSYLKPMAMIILLRPSGVLEKREFIRAAGSCRSGLIFISLTRGMERSLCRGNYEFCHQKKKFIPPNIFFLLLFCVKKREIGDQISFLRDKYKNTPKNR